jgi:hypothetical protein
MSSQVQLQYFFLLSTLKWFIFVTTYHIFNQIGKLVLDRFMWECGKQDRKLSMESNWQSREGSLSSTSTEFLTLY